MVYLASGIGQCVYSNRNFQKQLRLIITYLLHCPQPLIEESMTGSIPEHRHKPFRFMPH